MADLDRNRPFEKVWGFVSDDEPFFFQDGKSFRADGTLIEDSVKDEPKAESDTALAESLDSMAAPKKRGRKKSTPEAEVDLVNSDESDASEFETDDLV